MTGIQIKPLRGNKTIRDLNEIDTKANTPITYKLEKLNKS